MPTGFKSSRQSTHCAVCLLANGGLCTCIPSFSNPTTQHSQATSCDQSQPVKTTHIRMGTLYPVVEPCFLDRSFKGMHFNKCSPWAVGCCTPPQAVESQIGCDKTPSSPTEQEALPLQSISVAPRMPANWPAALVSSHVGEAKTYTIVQCRSGESRLLCRKVEQVSETDPDPHPLHQAPHYTALHCATPCNTVSYRPTPCNTVLHHTASPFRFGHCSASSLRALLYSSHPRA